MKRLSGILVLLTVCLWTVVAAPREPATLVHAGSIRDEGQSASNPLTPDPRYESDGVLQLESPPAFEGGGYPDEDPWRSDLRMVRQAHGLPTDDKLLSELLSSPDAQAVAASVGFPATPAEARQLLTNNARQEASIQLRLQLVAIPGWAGGEMMWSDDGTLDGMHVFAAAADAEEIRAAVVDFAKYDTSGLDVQVIERRYSLQTLSAIADRVSFGGTPIPDAARSPYEQDGAPTDLVDIEASAVRELLQLRGIKPVSIGVTTDDNGLAVSLRDDDLLAAGGPQEIVASTGLTIQIGRFYDEVGETGPDPCTHLGCAPVRGGVEIEYDVGTSSFRCTLGFGVVTGSDEDFITAGHCDEETRFDFQFARESGGYSNFFILDRDYDLGPTEANGLGPNSTSDTVELGVSDHLVTNRIYVPFDNGRMITGTVPHTLLTTSDRVCVSPSDGNYSCGLVEIASDSSYSAGGFPLLHQIRAGYTASGGDSGAPVIFQFARSTAVGTHSGGVTHEWASAVDHLGATRSGMQVYTASDRPGDFVRAMYLQALGRDAELSGFDYHRTYLTGSCGIDRARDVARGFLLSTEFRNKYPIGTLEQRQVRVEKAYRSVLGRASDTNGFNGGVANLTSEVAWTEIVNGFVLSPEFSNRVNGGGTYAYDGQICP